MGSTMMSITTLLLVISAVATSAVARTDIFQPYAGIDREIEMTTNVEAALSELNRYHGHGGYSYYPSYHHTTDHHTASHTTDPLPILEIFSPQWFLDFQQQQVWQQPVPYSPLQAL